MGNTNVIILSAGSVPPDVASVFGEIPSGMIPINGKPVISWIIDELIKQGFSEFIITGGFKKELLENYINNRYTQKCQIKLVEVDYRLAPGNSIITTLDQVDSNDILIVLGDTIFKDELRLMTSCVYTSPDFAEPTKWCLVESNENGMVNKIFDKMQIEDLSKLQALIGIYYLKNLSLLKKVVSNIDNSNRIEISKILQLYKEFEDIKCIECKEWFDIGHIDKYNQAKISLIDTRYFNDLQLDVLLGVVTKRSLNREKLTSEAKWFTNLPKEISILAPRIIDYQLENDPFLKMEYYGYPTLAELFVYGDLHSKIWDQIIGKLMNILQLFLQYKGYVSLDEYRYIYLTKTQRRIEELLYNDSDFKEIISYKTILLNGEPVLNFNSLLKFIEKEVNGLYVESEKNNCFIHGDFCFSNILFDLKSGIIRLIDPRGVWGESLYGDMRYDVAKLRHSVAGKYDLIINGFFTVKRKGNSFEMTTYSRKMHDNIQDIFDNHISQLWDINQIKLIEGLLFISMIPLHMENKDRQFAMYCAGLKTLNEVYKEKQNGRR